MNLFYASELTDEGGVLGKDESHHASRVLRLNSGDSILVTAGAGVIYEAEIISMTKSELGFKNTSVFKKEERPSYTHIAIAPTKSNDRFELFLEKATELGVDEFSPIICDHSERKVYKTARGEKILASASKQSLRCWWPKINEPKTFKEFLKLQEENDATKFMAYCGEGEKNEILNDLQNHENVLVMIGPEGDFSEPEAKMALASNIQLASLGPKRLRTETAGLAVAMAHSLLRSIPQ